MGEIVDNNTAPIDAPFRSGDYASPIPRPETNLNYRIVRIICGTLHSIVLGVTAGALAGGLMGTLMLSIGLVMTPGGVGSFANLAAWSGYGCAIGCVVGIFTAARVSVFCGIFTFVTLEFVGSNAMSRPSIFWQAVKGMRKNTLIAVPSGAILGLAASVVMSHFKMTIPVFEAYFHFGPQLDLFTGCLFGIILGFAAGVFFGAVQAAIKEKRNQLATVVHP